VCRATREKTGKDIQARILEAVPTGCWLATENTPDYLNGRQRPQWWCRQCDDEGSKCSVASTEAIHSLSADIIPRAL
jgi:hypothetical protein